MLKFARFVHLSVVGLLYGAAQPAIAQSISEVSTTQISRVKDLPRPATSVQEWLTQSDSVIKVIRVTIEPKMA